MQFNIEFAYIFLTIVITGVLGVVLFGLSALSVTRISYGEKQSTYECGFIPFSNTQDTSYLAFYLVAMMFLIFDIEIAILVPFATAAAYTHLFGLLIAGFFFIILTLGYIYELTQNALDFSNITSDFA